MKARVLLLTAAVSLMAGCRTTQHTTPVATKVHTLSIHVKDHQIHEDVYRFLRQDLQLPLVYEPVTQGQRRYVGLWVGNLVLEPCGPYSNIAYATPDFRAIFCGLTFESYESSTESAKQLEQRQIKHSLLGQSFVIINDPNLCEGNLVASIMDNPGRIQERQKHQALSSQLAENRGGPLGVEYVSEIQVGYTDPGDIDAWKAFLAPAKQIAPLQWQLGDRPVLRLIKGPRKEVKGIVLKVRSLNTAADYLKTNNLLGQKGRAQVQIKPPDDWEFAIILEE